MYEIARTYELPETFGPHDNFLFLRQEWSIYNNLIIWFIV